MLVQPYLPCLLYTSLGLSLVPMYFVHSLLPACLAGVLVGVGIAGVTANLDMVNSVLIEDDAARYGVRREATFFAGISFITRLSSLTRSGVFLLLFTLFGFESGEMCIRDRLRAAISNL